MVRLREDFLEGGFGETYDAKWEISFFIFKI